MSALIIAPHVDDELIGCYSVLQHDREITVLYLFEVDEQRKREAQKAGEALNFKPVFPTVLGDTFSWSKYSEIYVPTRRDSHPHHREANAIYRRRATHFYSVDMVGATTLLKKDQEKKKWLLDIFYPSQSALWEANHKYWLFEHITQRDYDEYAMVEAFDYKVTALEEYSSAVHRAICEHEGSADKLFNTLLSFCTQGTVELQHRERILRS